MNTTLQSQDSGSNYRFGDKMIPPKFSRSMFDLSHLVTTTIDNGGTVFPVDIIPVNPNEDYDISVRSLVRVLPQVVPLYSRQRLYIYAFYSRLGDLWNNFNTFMDKGYSGKTSVRRVPTINSNNTKAANNTSKIAPMSLGDCLNLPIGLTQNDFLDVISAMPFMMYFRIYRDYFANKNYFIDDRTLLPDDDSRFRLDDDGQLLSAKDQGLDFYFDFTSATPSDYVAPVGGLTPVAGHFGLFYHDWPDDYFTSALPFPQRGDEATANFSFDGTSAYADLAGSHIFSEVNSSGDPSPSSLVGDYGYLSTSDSSFASSSYQQSKILTSIFGYGSVASLATKSTGSTVPLTVGRYETPSSSSDLTSQFPVVFNSGSFNLTLDALRSLAVAQTEMEKLARTDGSYGMFGLTFFGIKSKNSYDFRPEYLGGTYVSLSFSEVLQTSAQYQVSDDVVSPLGSPVGTYAGHGIGVDSKGWIGHCTTDDFGYIMIVASIMPDVYYSQGLDKHWTNLDQSEFLLPERAKLGMKPILNKELMFTGDPDVDNDLWAWQNIFDEFRYMPNKIHGKIADPDSEDFFPYTQSRYFDTLPNYGKSFAEAQSVRKDYLSAYDEVAYTCQFALDIRAVRPLPYKPIPADILN